MIIEFTENLMNLLKILSSIHPPINASSILLKVGVNETGHRSFSIDIGGCDFDNMTTIAIFQLCATSPDCINESSKWPMSSESTNAKSHRIQFGILSGPKFYQYFGTGKQKQNTADQNLHFLY